MKIKKYLTFFLVVVRIMFCTSFSRSKDFLEQAFEPSKSHEQVVDLGNNKNAVGNEIFREGTEINLDAFVCKIGDQKITVDGLLPGKKKANCEAQ